MRWKTGQNKWSAVTLTCLRVPNKRRGADGRTADAPAKFVAPNQVSRTLQNLLAFAAAGPGVPRMRWKTGRNKLSAVTRTGLRVPNQRPFA